MEWLNTTIKILHFVAVLGTYAVIAEILLTAQNLKF